MTQFFITAIGTHVGKTFVASALCHQMPHMRAIKPIISGFDVTAPQTSDSGQLLLAQRLPILQSSLDAISPWRFVAPLSPHLAAEQEDRFISPDDVVSFCQTALKEHEYLCIEGVGGIMVPITPDWLVLDWMKALGLPIILVASSYLGAINHTLLSIELIRRHKLNLHAVVISQSAAEDVGVDATAASIMRWLPPHTRLLALPRLPAETPWKNAPDLLSLLA